MKIKENHNRVVSLYVIKTRLLFSSNFLELESFNFQTSLANYRVRVWFFSGSKNSVRALSVLKQSAIPSCFIPDKVLLLVFKHYI